MRIHLTLQSSESQTILPINYQYEIAAWVYKMIHYGNAAFAHWLHEKGYTKDGKSFKMFTFSNLEVERFQIQKDRFIILNQQAGLTVSFFLEDAASHFIDGLFRNSTITIGDKKSQGNFNVSTVQSKETPAFVNGQPMRLKALSPICLSKPVMYNDAFNAEYLAPDHEEYALRFYDNLVTRYNVMHPNETIEKQQIYNWKFKRLSHAKSRLITIKSGTPQETRVRGFLYDFECDAPAELLAFGYAAGFGEKGSLGFGCAGVGNELENKKVRNKNFNKALNNAVTF
jgi:CRISPR-associated endoribonuclease Cas6